MVQTPITVTVKPDVKELRRLVRRLTIRAWEEGRNAGVAGADSSANPYTDRYTEHEGDTGDETG